MFKPLNKSLSDIFQVMVAENQVYLPVQTVKQLSPFSGTSQTKISQMENCIILAYNTIPIIYQRFVHLLYIVERTVAELDNICMVEMRVRGKIEFFSLKIEIHVLIVTFLVNKSKVCCF
jgi:hypothetical protein